MINTIKDISEIRVHPQTGYFLATEKSLSLIKFKDHCGDCNKMSRVTMSCYAASKHIADETVARVQPKEKPKPSKPINKYGEMETSVSLDKYNGKLMNSIWGLYNRNSPHNFKKQNAESLSNKGQEIATEKFKSFVVQFTIPQFKGIVSVETKVEVSSVTKTQTSLDHFEALLNFPIF